MMKQEKMIRVTTRGLDRKTQAAVEALSFVALEDKEPDVWLVAGAEGFDWAEAQGIARRMVLVVDGLDGDRFVQAYGFMRVMLAPEDGPGALIQAIRTAARRDYYVSPSVSVMVKRLPSAEEFILLRLIFEHPGASYAELALHMAVMGSGARARMRRLYARSGTNSRQGLLLAATRRNWINPLRYITLEDAVSPLPEAEDLLLKALLRWPDAKHEQLAQVVELTAPQINYRMRLLFVRADVSSRAGLFVEALRRGWISVEDIKASEIGSPWRLLPMGSLSAASVGLM